MPQLYFERGYSDSFLTVSDFKEIAKKEKRSITIFKCNYCNGIPYAFVSSNPIVIT